MYIYGEVHPLPHNQHYVVHFGQDIGGDDNYMERGQLNMKRFSPSSAYYDAWCIFNGFQFPMLQCMSFSVSGKPGSKTLFITDAKENVIISFEEGMKCLDIDFQSKDRTTIEAEYRAGNKYLHQRKLLSVDERKLKDWIGFRMEITDGDGTVHTCPGQMSISPMCSQTDGVEPILIELLYGIAVCKVKGGG